MLTFIKPDQANTTMQNPTNPRPKVLHLSFNQDRGCFAVATRAGFSIYATDPLNLAFRRDSATISPPSGGTVGAIQMLYRYNIMALTGGGPNPICSPSKVIVWDDNKSQIIGQLSFPCHFHVISIQLRKDYIIVVLIHKVFVYTLSDLQDYHHVMTMENPKGLCEVSQASGSMVLVSLGFAKGHVQVVRHEPSISTKFIAAHEGDIACIALANDGRVLATASCKGTVIRIFDTVDGNLLQELRRGREQADIYSLSFSLTARYLAASSDRGTVHVFRLKNDSGSFGMKKLSEESEQKNISTQNTTSNLSFFKGFLPKYFKPERSLAQFQLPEGLKNIVAFGHAKDTVIIICIDGSFYKCKFDRVAGGMMTQLEHHNFLDCKEGLYR